MVSQHDSEVNGEIILAVGTVAAKQLLVSPRFAGLAATVPRLARR